MGQAHAPCAHTGSPFSSLLSKMCLFAKQSATYKSPRHRQCPTHRDFVPWRFSAAGHLSAWIDRHSGGRKPAQVRTLAVQKYLGHEGYRRNGAGGGVSAPPFPRRTPAADMQLGCPRAAMGVKKRAGYSATY